MKSFNLHDFSDVSSISLERVCTNSTIEKMAQIIIWIRKHIKVACINDQMDAKMICLAIKEMLKHNNNKIN